MTARTLPPIEEDLQRLEDLIGVFAQDMLKKIRLKAAQGRGGWNLPVHVPAMKAALVEHIQKAIDGDAPDDWVDVANFAAFLYFHASKREDR